jgi:hypothetical protein
MPHEPKDAGPREQLRDAPEGDQRFFEVGGAFSDALRNRNENEEEKGHANEGEVPRDSLATLTRLNNVVTIDALSAEVRSSVASDARRNAIYAGEVFHHFDHAHGALGEAS